MAVYGISINSFLALASLTLKALAISYNNDTVY